MARVNRPEQQEGWRLEWGTQLDIRPVRVHGDETINDQTVLAHATATAMRRRTLSHTAVSGYLAKYATKSTEDTGHVSQRLTPTPSPSTPTPAPTSDG